jgi:hypothetical protein
MVFLCFMLAVLFHSLYIHLAALDSKAVLGRKWCVRPESVQGLC